MLRRLKICIISIAVITAIVTTSLPPMYAQARSSYTIQLMGNIYISGLQNSGAAGDIGSELEEDTSRYTRKGISAPCKDLATYVKTTRTVHTELEGNRFMTGTSYNVYLWDDVYRHKSVKIVDVSSSDTKIVKVDKVTGNSVTFTPKKEGYTARLQIKILKSFRDYAYDEEYEIVKDNDGNPMYKDYQKVFCLNIRLDTAKLLDFKGVQGYYTGDGGYLHTYSKGTTKVKLGSSIILKNGYFSVRAKDSRGSFIENRVAKSLYVKASPKIKLRIGSLKDYGSCCYLTFKKKGKHKVIFKAHGKSFTVKFNVVK